MDIDRKPLLIIAILSYLWQGGHPLIAYDCGAPAMNITTLSLLDIQECDIPIQEPVTINVNIKLLQQVEYSHIKVRQCKIEIKRKIQYCGMHSHIAAVKNGEIEYIQEVTPEECYRIHLLKTYQAYNTLFNNLVVNSSNPRPVTMAGTVSNDGSCKGTSYSDPYGNWDNVIVTGNININLYEYEATINLKQNEVILKSGNRCKLNAGSCLDWEGGNTRWDLLPDDKCKFNNYEVIYEGRADRIKDTKNSLGSGEIFSITSSDITFALAVKGKITVCGYNLFRTEHPKIYISETILGDGFPAKHVSVMNMDILAYVNVKLIYVVRNLGNQITSLYNNIMKQECEIEKRVLRNTLGFASLAPAEFAYHYMNKPGYMAHVAGEVIRLAKCVPVEVKTRKTVECFQELAIFRGNQSLFMLPRTRIITQTGRQIECNSFLSPMYQINGNWYQSLPQLAQAAPPEEIPAITKPTWKFITPAHLADSGIYSTQDLENIRSSMMFPIEKTAVLSTFARGAAGQKTLDQGISIDRWVNEDVIEKSVKKIWGKMYSFFNTIGTFSSTLLGIWMTFKFIKFAMDTLVHGYALHTIYGWSIWLIGSIWDSVTNLLLHLSRKPSPTETSGKVEDIPLQNTNASNDSFRPIYPAPCLPHEIIPPPPVWQPRNYPVNRETAPTNLPYQQSASPPTNKPT